MLEVPDASVFSKDVISKENYETRDIYAPSGKI
jgi:hypothetical protein